MKRLCCSAMAVAFVLLMGPVALAKVSWDMPVTWPPENIQTQNAKIFAEEIKKATNGEVEIIIHAGGSLGYRGPEMLSVVRDGLAPIGQLYISQLVGEEQFFAIEPMVPLELLATLQKFSRPVYEKLARKHNQKVLYMSPWPDQKLFVKKEINSMNDLKHLKVRTVDKYNSDYYDFLGATSVQMPWGEVIPALASGVIDGVSTSNPSAVDGKFWEFLKYGYKFDWHSSSDMITVNLDAWNKLTPELREIIESKARELEPLLWKRVKESDLKSEAVLKSNGIQIIDPNPELKTALAEKWKLLWENFMKTSPEAKQVVEDYRIFVGME